MTEVEQRVAEANAHTQDWKKWGPYLAERAWGTVREDYSADGNAWDYLPHDFARSHAYRWNEDGLLGICDRRQWLCFAPALWNGKDPILKERPFGLNGHEGNHGEDVKDYYYHLDCTPTHCYMKALYKYQLAPCPYDDIVAENARRGREQPEYELLDTGVFDDNRYFDVFVEYAKADVEDILIRFTIVNHCPEAATLHLLPTLWFRNTWAWGDGLERPQIHEAAPVHGGPTDTVPYTTIQAQHNELGTRWLLCQTTGDSPPPFLFTDNESNLKRMYGPQCIDPSLYLKDAFHECVVHGNTGAVNPAKTGTKAAAHYVLTIPPGGSQEVRLRLTDSPPPADPLGTPFTDLFTQRIQEADAFYATLSSDTVSDDAKQVQRQAFAGLLWSKQFYNYAVARWLDGDPGQLPPPKQRQHGRNDDWRHFYGTDVFSMPDTWEYPWFAAWDLAFHCIPLALVDPSFAKRQLTLLCREWFMHPNGQLPAYEWAFSDVNPPVHATAAMRVYQIERRMTGKGDRDFLERIFHKLLINFTWWVNRKDPEGHNVFQGGFLGLDNIGVFDRSAPLPNGEFLEQSDGTAWMGLFCLSMLAIAIELAREDLVYEDVATKFFEHFMYIAGALNNIAMQGVSLWDEDDQFFYDVLRMENGSAIQLKARSLVGLVPLLAVETIEQADLDRMPGFKERMQWFLTQRPDLANLVSHLDVPGMGERRLLSLVRTHRMNALLTRALDPHEFLSPYGLRSVSKYHEQHPYVLQIDGQTRSVDYEPAESKTTLFGGNSNWRGPVWFPINYLLIEALQRFDVYYGHDYKVECPTGSGQMLSLWEVSQELSRRMIALFLRDHDGRRPVFGPYEKMQSDPHWRDCLLFYEYFHGDTGMGLGASHQTGWTALVAKMIQQSGE